MSEDKDLLKSNIVQGFGTLIVREFFIKIFSFLGQIFLARLLAPSDFGVYVIVIFVVNFFSLFTDIGLSLAIIQKNKEPTRMELSSVFLIKIFLSSIIIFLIWFISPFIKIIYPTFIDANVVMIRIFSLTLVLSSLRAIPIAMLERKIKYNLISLTDILGVFIFYVISLVLAYMHFGVWSLIIGSLASEISQTISIYFFQPFYPLFVFSINSIKRMVKFGIYIQGNSLVNIINSSITPVIGGRISGLSSVGLLDFAFNIASLPITIAINFGRVAFAGYSRIQNERKILFNSISKSISMLAIILYIFPVIVFGLGRELVPLVFSPKWTPAIPALYWYSFGTFFLPIISALGQGILVIGKSKEVFWTNFIAVVSSWFGSLIFIYLFGFVGIAVAYFLLTVVFCLSYIIIFQRSGYIFPLLKIIAPKLLVVFFSLLVVFFMNITLPNTLQVLIFKFIALLFLYLCFLFIFVKQDSKELFGIFYKRFVLSKL